MSTEETAEAVVLRFTPYGESDRMASLLMRDGSRREVRVAQARKSRKRFGGFDLYVRLECRFMPDRKGRPRLDSVEIRDGHEGLRGELVRSALAAHVSELAHQASQEGHALPDLYRLVLAGLTSIAAGAADKAPLGWARGFELKLLHVLGVRPALLRDAVTSRPLETPELRWSTTHGGALLPDGPTDARSLRIRLATLSLMNDALRTPLADQGLLVWTETSGVEAERALQDFLAVHVGRRSRARAFLTEVASGIGVVALLAVALVGIGCAGYVPPDSVRVQGYLFESPAPIEGATVVVGSSSSAVSNDGELVVEGSEPFSDSPGWVRFSGLSPLTPHHHVFVPPEGEGEHPESTEHVVTVIAGSSASDDLFVDAGTFHLWPRSTAEGWSSAWGLVDGSLVLPTFNADSTDGGFVRGGVLNPEAFLGTRFVLVDANGVQRFGSYLDGDGAPSVSQDGLSESGGFFVFGAAAGLGVLRLVEDDGSPSPDGLPIWVEEDGVTSLPRLQLGQ